MLKRGATEAVSERRVAALWTTGGDVDNRRRWTGTHERRPARLGRCRGAAPADGPRQGGLTGAVGGSAPGGRAGPHPDVPGVSTVTRSGPGRRRPARDCADCPGRSTCGSLRTAPALATVHGSGKLARRVRPATEPARRSAAFFDLDKTIIAGSSALAFSRPFRRQGLITRRAVLRSGYAQLLIMLSGADAATMDSIARRITALCAPGGRCAGPRDRRGDPARDRRAPCVRRGHRADRRAPRRGGRGRGPVGLWPRGGRADRRAGRRRLLPGHPDGCRRRAATRARSSGISTERRRRVPRARSPPHAATAWQDCRAYSDSITDLPLLEVVGHPTAVNPDRALRRVAEERGWPVLSFAVPVALRPRIRPTTAAVAGAGLGAARSSARAGTGPGSAVCVGPMALGELNRCTRPEGLPMPARRVTKSSRTLGRPGAVRQRSTRPPRPGLRVRGPGPPRAARRGRHVVVGLRIGTPDAEAATTTRSARWIPALRA